MRLPHVARNGAGFTIVELLLSMAIMLGITGVIFSLVDPARGTYQTQPEISDMQQRLRVGTTFLRDDLLMAGAGSLAGGNLTGTLMNFFAPVQPVLLGGANSDPLNGIFYRDNAISVFYIPPTSPQTTIAANMPQPSAELKIGRDISCPPGGDPLCNWKAGMRVMIFDDEGAFDVMTITHVQSGSGGGPPVEGMLQHNKRIAGNDLSKKYTVGAQVAQVAQRTYYWVPNTRQLRYFDGADQDEAVIDDVVDVQFTYFAEPRPPVVLSEDDRTTSYGPKPPPLGTQQKGGGNNANSAWPAGENCVFRVNPLNPTTRIARIPDLAPGSQALVPLTEAMLTDGPWCPDQTFPTRFDADLLRVRKIGVRMRVQVTSADLRGPASVLFRQGGTSTSSRRLVPDQELQFEISPRNFNLAR